MSAPELQSREQRAEGRVEDGLQESAVLAKRPLTLILLSALCILPCLKPAEAVTNLSTSSPFSQPEMVPNEILVKLKRPSVGKLKNKAHPSATDTGLPSLDKLNRASGVQKFERIAVAGKHSNPSHDLFLWYKVSLKPFTSKKTITSQDKNEHAHLQQLIEQYKADSNVDTVEPNYVIHAAAIPNDPYYSSTGSWGVTWYSDMWGLKIIHAAGAWDQSTGSASIIVADIDTGVDRNHPDLAANMWYNPGEPRDTNGNCLTDGLDHDGNGYADDCRGWDFRNHDNDPMDDQLLGHGTNTAGIIGAVGNNGVGMVGVNWTTRIMALKFMDAYKSGFPSDAAAALQYAADMGARVSNNSYGDGIYQVMEDAVKYEHDKGMVIVASAGNSTLDALDISPASADDAMAVSATYPDDTFAPFSNFGSKIDVAAPGVNILSTYASGADHSCVPTATTGCAMIGTDYFLFDGTSAAAPFVSGLAALLLSKNPSLTNEEVRQLIRSGADDLGPVGFDSSFGYGRINANNTLALSSSHPLTPYISSPKSRTPMTGSAVPISGSIGGINFANYTLAIGAGRSPSTWMTIKTSNIQPATNQVLGSVDTRTLPDGSHTLRLTATNLTGRVFIFEIHDLAVKNFTVSINSPGDLAPQGQVTVTGSAFTNNGVVLGSYQLEASNATGWTTIGSGTQPVNNGPLGVWDTTQMADGAHTLRLTVTATNGISQQFQRTTTVDSGILNGWPKALDQKPTYMALGDLNGDGKKEIVTAQFSSGLLVAYKSDGSIQPGFPVNVKLPSGSLSGNLGRQMLVTDIDNDGKQEIIVPVSGDTGSTLDVYRGDGSMYPGWVPPAPAASATGGEPFFADINGDGVKDIVVLSQTPLANTTVVMTLAAYDRSGKSLAGFPRTTTWNMVGNPNLGQISMHDLFQNGKYEFAFTIDDKAYVVNDQLQLLPGWPYTFPSPASDGLTGYVRKSGVNTLMSSADFYGDGKRELFLFNNTVCQGTSCEYFYSLLVGLNPDGTMMPGFPKSGKADGYSTKGDPNISHADIDGDGADDIVLGSQPMAIYTKNGLSRYSQPYTTVAPALADLDGDGKIEFVGSNTTMAISSVSIGDDNGDFLWTRSVTSPQEPSLLADLDGDGKLELVQFYVPLDTTTFANLGNQLIVWKLDFGGTAKYDWPMVGQNPFRDNNLRSSVAGAPPPKSPCDVNKDGATNALDVQQMTNQALGIVGCTTGDINKDTLCNVIDVQRVTNAALGGQCVSP